MSPWYTRRLLRKLASTPVKFKDAITDREFTAMPVDVFIGEAEINRQLTVCNVITVRDYLEFLGCYIPEEELSLEKETGWACECLLENGENWLELEYICENDNQKEPVFLIKPKLFPCNGFCNCHIFCD